MADFNGHLLDPPFGYPLPADPYPATPRAGWNAEWGMFWNGNPQSFTSWNTEWGFDWDSIKRGFALRRNETVDRDIPVLSGIFNDRQPYIPTSRNITGYNAGSFSDIFYNRVVVEPLFIDFGSLTGNAQSEFVVWNAYFTNANLQTIQENGFGTGLEFSGELLPKTFLPLEEITYTVDASLNGPPVIDATLVFDFTTPDAIQRTVSFTGSRIVFLPLIYRDSMTERLEWDTDILNSYNGKEQRIMNRVQPRQFLDIEGFIPTEITRSFENLLYGWRGRFWAIPIWQEARGGSDINAGESIINVDTMYGDFRVGSLVGIWQDQDTFDIANVINITDGTLSFDRGINRDYVDPIVFPVRLARMTAAPVRTTTGYNAVLSTNLQVTDNVSLETSASDEQYDGEDVFLEIPEAPSGTTIDDNYETRIDLIDYSTGAIEQVLPWDNQRINRTFTLLKEGLEEIWNCRLWLHRRAGRLRPFWMPTFEDNMKVLTTTFIADNFFIEPENYASQGVDRRNIIFFFNDDTHSIVRIIDTNTNDPERTQITIVPPLNREGADISSVSFIGLKRLASDRISIRWLQNNVAIFTIPIKEIIS